MAARYSRWRMYGVIVAAMSQSGIAFSLASDMTCETASRFAAAAAPTDGVFDPDQAVIWIGELRGSLDAAPTGNCAHALRSGLIATLGSHGRAAEGAEVAWTGLDHEIDVDRRVELGNSFVALRTRGLPQPLTAEVRAECRAVATSALAGTRTLDDLLASAMFEELASVVPLHHVVASTHDDPQQRLQSLVALGRFCARAMDAARAQSNRESLLMDQYLLAREAVGEYIGLRAEPSVPELLDLVRLAPPASNNGQTRHALLGRIVRDARLSAGFRTEVLSSADESIGPQGAKAVLRHSLLMEAYREALASATPDWSGVLDGGLRAWEAIQDAELNAGVDLPAGVTSRALWSAAVRSTLAINWRVASERAGRHDAAAVAARAFLERFPDTNPAPSMRRYLGEP